jgi:uncharacterized protein involved in exopolysaccharide biosynthesis
MDNTGDSRDGRAGDEGTISFFEVGVILLSYRRLVIVLGLVGAGLGAALALFSPVVYESRALFQPQLADGQDGRLTQVASRFGLGVVDGKSQWGPSVYVELLATQNVLAPVVKDTLFLEEDDRRPLPIIELVGLTVADTLRLDRAVEALKSFFKVGEITEIGAVEVVVATPWPSASRALAEKLVRSVDRFSVSERRTRAAQESAFVANRKQAAEEELKDAENLLMTFLDQNRNIADSPQLQFQYERLKRDVELKRDVYVSLVHDLADAEIREVRDIPVITMLESPHRPTRPRPRHLVLKTALGALAGVLLGAAIGCLAYGWKKETARSSSDAAAFRDRLQRVWPWSLVRK